MFIPRNVAKTSIASILSQRLTVKSLKGSWEVFNMQYTAGAPGSGAGRGGGAGGTIKEAGGGLGQFGTAQEENYFYKQQKEKLLELKKRLKDKFQLNKKDDK